MGGRKYELSPEEYIFASLILYMDIIRIFLLLLAIFGRGSNWALEINQMKPQLFLYFYKYLVVTIENSNPCVSLTSCTGLFEG